MKLLALALLILAAPAPQEAAPEMGITTDSLPGWQPSAEQAQAVLRASQEYLDALEAGDPARAHAMMTPESRARTPLSAFFQQSERTRDASGPLRARRYVRISWTRNPAGAAPGIYAVVDIAARHAKVDRECALLLWYQRAEGGPFKLMRADNAQIDNFTADRIAGQKGEAELDKLWMQLSARCAPTGTPHAP